MSKNACEALCSSLFFIPILYLFFYTYFLPLSFFGMIHRYTLKFIYFSCVIYEIFNFWVNHIALLDGSSSTWKVKGWLLKDNHGVFGCCEVHRWYFDKGYDTPKSKCGWVFTIQGCSVIGLFAASKEAKWLSGIFSSIKLILAIALW